MLGGNEYCSFPLFLVKPDYNFPYPMKIEKYPLEAENSLTVFEFVSEGPNGKIRKLVQFQETSYPDVYNLAFVIRIYPLKKLTIWPFLTMEIEKRYWQQLCLPYMHF